MQFLSHFYWLLLLFFSTNNIREALKTKWSKLGHSPNSSGSFPSLPRLGRLSENQKYFIILLHVLSHSGSLPSQLGQCPNFDRQGCTLVFFKSRFATKASIPSSNGPPAYWQYFRWSIGGMPVLKPQKMVLE